MNWHKWLVPVAIAWAALNVLGMGYAVVVGEPVHALVHGVFVVAFGSWAYWLRRVSRNKRVDKVDVDRLSLLEDELTDVQRELQQTREGLEFTEQLLRDRPKQERQ